MSQLSSSSPFQSLSSSSSFQSLFNAALQDYAKRTGRKLDDDPLAKQFEKCDTADAIFSVLQEQARRFHEFRGKDGKIVRSLKSAINVLYALSVSAALGEGIGVVCLKPLMANFRP